MPSPDPRRITSGAAGALGATGGAPGAAQVSPSNGAGRTDATGTASAATTTTPRPASALAGPDRLDAVFAALADPTRRAILSLLLEDDMAVSDVAAGFSISLAAISRHLGVLAAAGLIRQDRRGRITWCQIEPESLRAAMVWMRGFGQIDPLDLDAFERFLQAEGLGLSTPPAGAKEE